jgi:hypothetical protein
MEQEIGVLVAQVISVEVSNPDLARFFSHFGSLEVC